MPSLNTGNAILSNAITVDGSYNVGIGGSPSYKLDVTGTGRFTSALTIGSTESTWNLASSNKLQIQNSLLVGYSTTGTFLTMNLNYNSGWKYISTGAASIYSQDTGDHVFYTSVSGTAAAAATLNEKMRITNSGNVGIGTSSPSALLDVNGNLNVSSFGNIFTATTSGIFFSGYNSYAVGIYNDNSGVLRFQTASTERMRITSGGELCVGTTSASFTASNRGNITIGGTSTSILSMQVNGLAAGNIYHNGTDMQVVNYKNGNLYFGTNDTYRMTITSLGTVAINSTYSNTVYKLVTKVGTDRNIAFGIQSGDCSIECFNDAVNAGVPLRIYAAPLYLVNQVNDTTGSGANMVIDASTGRVYRSTSSLKYKTNVQNYTKGLQEVMQLRPVSYNGKSEVDEGKTFAGLIAEEVHDLGLTEFVQYAEDGTPDALAYQNMVALLTKAIQEQQAQIEELKALINK